MLTSDEIKARYQRIEKEVDALGRSIGVHRLRPSQRGALEGMTLDQSGDVAVESEGKTVQIPRRLPFTMAASVCEIDGNHIPFPRTRGELDAILDRLDDEGVHAATIAFSRLVGGDTPQSTEDAAKN